MSEYGEQLNYIDGEWRPARDGKGIAVLSPSTEEQIATLADSGSEDVEEAVSAAFRAFAGGRGEWARRPARERLGLLEGVLDGLLSRAEGIGLMEARDVGHPLRLAQLFHAAGAPEFARAAIRLVDVDNTEALPLTEAPTLSANFVLREPVGVCGVIVPWNGAYFLSLYKVFSALVTGNAVVLKPPPEASLSCLEIARALAAGGLPSGNLNVVTGGTEPGAALAANSKVDRISFTGSTTTGRRVLESSAADFKRVTLELGGKSPVILCADVDLDRCVDGVLWGAFLQSGQVCAAGSRLLVPEERYDEVVERIVERASVLAVGDPLDPTTDIGPLISSQHRERVERYITAGLEEGAKLVLGGGRPTQHTRGYFVEPTIFAGVDHTMTIAQEEIFGPVLSIIRYDGLAQAIEIANGTAYGLTASVWSRSNRQALEVARQLQAGTVWINEHNILNPHAPFGGYKHSGVGREFGRRGLEEFCELKHVHVDLSTGPAEKPYGLLFGGK